MDTIEALTAQRTRLITALRDELGRRKSAAKAQYASIGRKIGGIQKDLSIINKRLDRLKLAKLSNAGKEKEKQKQEELQRVVNIKEQVGYSEAEPERCFHCLYFSPAVKKGKENYRPRCTKFQFHVKPSGICDHYEEA